MTQADNQVFALLAEAVAATPPAGLSDEVLVAARAARSIGQPIVALGGGHPANPAAAFVQTNGSDAKTPFYATSTGGAALPTLSLPRVYVLTQGDTCSASEAIINGLRGVDVDVRLIGGTTCGKPYGFTAKDNCGISYFPIEFKGVNAKGFGDYADGFVPAGTSVGTGVAGCVVSDDLSHALGDTSESMLATALGYRSTGSCPVLSVAPAQALSAGGAGASSTGFMVRGPARENRLLSPSR